MSLDLPISWSVRYVTALKACHHDHVRILHQVDARSESRCPRKVLIVIPGDGGIGRPVVLRQVRHRRFAGHEPIEPAIPQLGIATQETGVHRG